MNEMSFSPISLSGPNLPEGFSWFNKPCRYSLNGNLEIITDPGTDFWQRTHYDFEKDNGHFLYTRISGDFSMQVRARFEPKTQYDQCGLMVRVDTEHWIKMGTEYENAAVSRLGSVVTNRGYSDWATQDIPSSIKDCWYRISRLGADFLLTYRYDGSDWRQMRIAHLHLAPESLLAGPYACSPQGGDCLCRFFPLEIKNIPGRFL